MDALARQQELVGRVAGALRAAAGAVQRYETHISWVLVAGGHAYKFKKALALPFMDCSTLAARRFYCFEEYRLNRRLAPDLYLGVVAVGGGRASPAIGAPGAPLDYAVHMRAFGQDALWSARLARGRLGGGEVDRLAASLAAFHGQAPRAPAAAGWGSPETVAGAFAATLAALEAEAEAAELAHDAAAALAAVRAWLARRQPAFAGLVAARRAAGMVRECHGDLHCSNLLTLGDQVQAFDCIEFDPALRWIDVIDDLAFACMDLGCRGRSDLAARLLNAYLEHSGDYAGLAVLPDYRVHRALVRARVVLLRARQGGAPDAVRRACLRRGRSYLRYAQRCTRPAGPVLVAMHGFSGSGKTGVARRLVELLGAVQLRSDVERKRLPGAGPVAQDLRYGEDAARRTYARLGELARAALRAGWPVVVDAACLLAAQRRGLRDLAAELALPFFLVDVRAAPATLRARLAARQAAGEDASDADAAVLAMQLGSAEPLAPDERAQAIVIDTDTDTAAGGGADRLRAASAPMLAALARGRTAAG